LCCWWHQLHRCFSLLLDRNTGNKSICLLIISKYFNDRLKILYSVKYFSCQSNGGRFLDAWPTETLGFCHTFYIKQYVFLSVHYSDQVYKHVSDRKLCVFLAEICIDRWTVKLFAKMLIFFNCFCNWRNL
jgi:hypothetical protein